MAEICKHNERASTCVHCRNETIDRLTRELAEARGLCAEQAEDEGLWFVAETAAEAYLQQELRRLHAAVEAGMQPDQPPAMDGPCAMCGGTGYYVAPQPREAQ